MTEVMEGLQKLGIPTEVGAPKEMEDGWETRIVVFLTVDSWQYII